MSYYWIAFGLPLQYYCTLLILSYILGKNALKYYLTFLKLFTALTFTVCLYFTCHVPLMQPSSFQFFSGGITLLPYLSHCLAFFKNYQRKDCCASTDVNPNPGRTLLLSLKNAWVAPFIEEYIFRHLLFHNISSDNSISLLARPSAIGSILFGLAHLHLIVDKILFDDAADKVSFADLLFHSGTRYEDLTFLSHFLSLGFQFIYTTIFALYAQLLYIKAGTLFSS